MQQTTLPLTLPDRLARERILHLLRESENRKPLWKPLRGPQRMAYDSEADVIGYGGAAGGGKTDLLLGKAITQHRRVQIFRREGTELSGLVERCAQIVGNRDGLGGKPQVWREPGGNCEIIEFLSVPNLGDETKYQGRPKDLLGLDEAANFMESQVRFLMGWVRSTTPGQKCQTLMTFNPPTTVEGRWIVDFFAPWIDPMHPNPAAPGELRWFGSISGKDIEVKDATPFVIIEGKVTYEFEPMDYEPEHIIVPKSRTFIPSNVKDNPYLLQTGYMSTLQALPEPLRSQMLYGDFQAGMKDDPWQVIPTEWVDAAMARWKPFDSKPHMDSMGVDVARGGSDRTVIARRHGTWFDELLKYPGKETPDGPTAAGLVIAAMRNGAPQHIDVIGVGASVYDFLSQAKQQAIPVNVAESARGRDLSGTLTFLNLRSELWWRMREALDPTNNLGIALPPDKELRADLCAPKWELSGKTIKVQSREEIIKTIGRSPDMASAVVLALMDTPSFAAVRATVPRQNSGTNYDPTAIARGGHNASVGHDPYASIR
jgi:hypothetical protein